jgi:hypothetical protein
MVDDSLRPDARRRMGQSAETGALGPTSSRPGAARMSLPPRDADDRQSMGLGRHTERGIVCCSTSGLLIVSDIQDGLLDGIEPQHAPFDRSTTRGSCRAD